MINPKIFFLELLANFCKKQKMRYVSRQKFAKAKKCRDKEKYFLGKIKWKIKFFCR